MNRETFDSRRVGKIVPKLSLSPVQLVAIPVAGDGDQSSALSDFLRRLGANLVFSHARKSGRGVRFEDRRKRQFSSGSTRHNGCAKFAGRDEGIACGA